MRQEVFDDLNMASLERYMAYLLEYEDGATSVDRFFEHLASRYRALSDMRTIAAQMLSVVLYAHESLEAYGRVLAQVRTIQDKIRELEKYNAGRLEAKMSVEYKTLRIKLLELYAAKAKQELKETQAMRDYVVERSKEPL